MDFLEGVPYNGYYEVRLLLEAKNRDHTHPENRVLIDKDEPMMLGIIPGNRIFGELHNPQPYEEVLAKINIPDGEPQWHSSTVWIDKGFTPRFIYINGPSGARGNQANLGHKILKEKKALRKRFGTHYSMAMIEGMLPHIRIHEIEIRGPFYEQWPPRGRQDILGDEPFSPQRVEKIVSDFASKAYRRKATPEEVQRILKVAKSSRADGRTPYESLQDSIKTVLCSPGFLYLEDQTESDKKCKAQ